MLLSPLLPAVMQRLASAKLDTESRIRKFQSEFAYVCRNLCWLMNKISSFFFKERLCTIPAHKTKVSIKVSVSIYFMIHLRVVAQLNQLYVKFISVSLVHLVLQFMFPSHSTSCPPELLFSVVFESSVYDFSAHFTLKNSALAIEEHVIRYIFLINLNLSYILYQ